MIYIETNSADVCYNFGAEYYFTAEKPLDGTVFLFWRTTPTLMVGRYQNVLEEVDRVYADAHGIRIVRRMSGSAAGAPSTPTWAAGNSPSSRTHGRRTSSSSAISPPSSTLWRSWAWKPPSTAATT